MAYGRRLGDPIVKDIREVIVAKEKELGTVRRELAILKEALRILYEPHDAPLANSPAETTVPQDKQQVVMP